MPRTYTYSAVGGHAENQDAFVLVVHPDAPEVWIAVVADGQGGQSGAKPAAWRAVQTCTERAVRCPAARLFLPFTWTALVSEADRAVRDDQQAGYTTLVALAADGRFVCDASVGDSKAVLAQGGQRLLDLTDQQGKNPAIGSGSARPTPFGVRLSPPWTLVLMSDGVWKYTAWEAALTDPTRPGDLLLADLQRQAQLRPDGPFQDDFTVMVVQSDPVS